MSARKLQTRFLGAILHQDRERLDRILVDAAGSIAELVGIEVYDPLGTAVASTDPEMVGKSHFDRVFFEECRSGRRSSLPRRRGRPAGPSVRPQVPGRALHRGDRDPFGSGQSPGLDLRLLRARRIRRNDPDPAGRRERSAFRTPTTMREDPYAGSSRTSRTLSPRVRIVKGFWMKWTPMSGPTRRSRTSEA